MRELPYLKPLNGWYVHVSAYFIQEGEFISSLREQRHLKLADLILRRNCKNEDFIGPTSSGSQIV